MPKDKKEQGGYHPEQSQDERFRTFFTTSVADIPLKMTEEHDEPEPHGLFDRLFGHKGREESETEPEPAAGETGEILIGAEQDEPMADLELAMSQEEAAKSFFKETEPEPEAEPEPEQPAAVPQEPAAEPAAAPEPQPASAPAPAPAQPKPPASQEPKQEEPKEAPIEPPKQAEPDPRLPQEEQEEHKLEELRAMLRRMSGSQQKAPAKAEPKPQPKAPAAPAVQPKPEKQETAKPAPAPQPAPKQPEPEEEVTLTMPKAPEQPEESEDFHIDLFGVGEDETPAGQKPAEDDDLDLDLPLFGEDVREEAAAPEIELPEQPEAPKPEETVEKAPEAAAEPAAPAEAEAAAPDGAEAPSEEAAAPAEAETTGEQAAPEAAADAATAEAAEPESIVAEDAEPEPNTPEGIAERLKQMRISITLRCVLSAVLAVVLLHLGLVAEGLTAPFGGLDPVASRTAFYGVNLLLYLAAMGVSYPILRDGLSGLRGRPSSETMPALAAVAAFIQAFIAFVNAKSYQPSSLTLLTGIAALGLFMAQLGDLVMLRAVSEGFALLNSGIEQQGACRARNKDVIRSLSRDLDQKDPWILLSRPLDWEEGLIGRCFDERASERRTRKVAYVLLAAAVLSGLLFLCFGAGINGGAAALTAVLCMGAPLSSTLIAGLTTLRLQRAAGAVGAMVPGWAAIEELGGIDTVQADAGELFGPECVLLEDIRIFKGGRIDRAILYAASVLNESCNTLRGLFNQIIEERTEILFPVKDLEFHRGLGFSAWCDNNRILIGTRLYMEKEGVLLPEQAYEDKHSKNGELQILYLAVSGNLHAMFVLRYQGGRHAAHGLEILQRENMRLLVSCQDPSLTARHITEAYHLPEGMVSLLDTEQCDTLAAGAHDLRETPCCLVHLKGFASLTGGLRAAEQAQNAETAATTVQIVSVLFSVVIAVLLTSAGSVGAMSVVTVLMYQAAWSALSIAVCALKQLR